jgi:DNA-binding beta-propeller fold protein YncE
MKRLACVLAVLAACLALAGAYASEQPLAFATAIPLPRVRGRIDHLAVDAAAGRLYVAALGNDSLEVIDIGKARHLESIPGLREPQGLGFVAATGQLVVANGQGAGIEFRDARDLRVVRRVALGEDSDNVRVDPRAGRVFVGYGSGAVAAIDATDGRKVGEVALDGHPESFQLETAGPRIYVNVPTARHVAVIDRTRMKIEATWQVSSAASNYPMALDEDGHRLFIGCRRPAVVLVYDTASGTQTAAAQIAGDTDDLFWDGVRHRLYVSAGEGFIDVLQFAGRRLERVAHVPTAPGARTSLFVASLDRLFLAVPQRGDQAAEIRAYDAPR